MKNKGFTLVELLAVVAVLLILITVITPKVMKQLKTSEDVTQEQQINTLIDIARIYANENTTMLPEENEVSIIKISELKQAGLVDKKQIIDPKTKEEMNGCILITLQQNKYDYEYINGHRCNLSKNGLYQSTTEPGRLIYRGADPDNYIVLKEDGTNDTLYRIVSYETDGTVKVVRNEKLSTNMAWDAQSGDYTGPRLNGNNTYCRTGGIYIGAGYVGCNVWGNMNNTYYNGATLSPEFKYRYYLNESSTTLQDGTYTGTVTMDSSLNTYLNGSWLNSTSLSNYIADHNFGVGGIYYQYDYNSSEPKNILQEKQEEENYIWNGKIGLLNITEYAESSTNSSCTGVWSSCYSNPNFASMSNNEFPCKYENYNYKSEYTQYSISPYTFIYNDVWGMGSSGGFGNNHASHLNGVRPAFYLKSTINLLGEGTQANPYRIIEN